MHRPAPRRSRRLAALIALIALTACSGGSTAASPEVVAVSAQPCSSPNRALGLGVVVADHLVATAAHTVEGPLRDLRVDGRPATLVTVDARTDLALLAAPDVGTEPAELSEAEPSTATLLTPGAEQPVEIVSTGPLVVHDTTAGVRHERQVHRISPAVTRGTSGAPLVDDDNRVLGIVVLSEPGNDIAYAITAGELEALIEDRLSIIPQASEKCPG
jgi:S1-C subfamily serine protease